jgi:hypothetical protein
MNTLAMDGQEIIIYSNNMKSEKPQTTMINLATGIKIDVQGVVEDLVHVSYYYSREKLISHGVPKLNNLKTYVINIIQLCETFCKMIIIEQHQFTIVLDQPKTISLENFTSVMMYGWKSSPYKSILLIDADPDEQNKIRYLRVYQVDNNNLIKVFEYARPSFAISFHLQYMIMISEDIEIFDLKSLKMVNEIVIKQFKKHEIVYRYNPQLKRFAYMLVSKR